ncbi:MAG: hypothetical protein WB341_10220 [Terracidiphilus sp.]
MHDFQGAQLGEMSIDQLIEFAARESSIAGDSGSADVHHGRARTCLEIANLRLAQEDQSLKRQQIEAAKLANSLSERILKGNEESARAASQSSAAMNKATQQLASSTSGLNKATWVLVGVTFVQAIIAFAMLYVSISSHK